MPTVLLVEDDPKLARVICDYLMEHGYEVTVEMYGNIAVRRIIEENPDAVILDINLPEMDGFAICRQVRNAYQGAIIMLTARTGDMDEVLGLELGAEDYLTKPVRPTVLLARLGVHLKRGTVAKGSFDDTLHVGDLRVFPKRRMVELRGKSIDLKAAEFDLLVVLARSPGTIITRSDLFDRCNPGETFDFRDRSIDLRISRLRKKLQDDPNQPKLIVSIRGNGYMLVDQP